MIPTPDFTNQELTAIVQECPDEKLAEWYRKSQSGTEWHRMLSEEIGRRDALGSGTAARES